MSIIWARARCACDDCGKAFVVDIDCASTGSESVFDMVCEGLRGGLLAEASGSCSYFEGGMRCGDCTEAYVTAWIASHPNHICGVTMPVGPARDLAEDVVEVETHGGARYRLKATLLGGFHPLSLIDRHISGFGVMPPLGRDVAA